MIGVGATQVGNQTQHYVEIDPEFFDLCTQLNVGIVGGDTHGHTECQVPQRMRNQTHLELG